MIDCNRVLYFTGRLHHQLLLTGVTIPNNNTLLSAELILLTILLSLYIIMSGLKWLIKVKQLCETKSVIIYGK